MRLVIAKLINSGGLGDQCPSIYHVSRSYHVWQCSLVNGFSIISNCHAYIVQTIFVLKAVETN